MENEVAGQGPEEPLRTPSIPGTEIPSYFMSRNIGLLIKDALHNSNVVEVEFYADFPNMTDILILDRSDVAKPALVTNQNPEDVIGITVETGSYCQML